MDGLARNITLNFAAASNYKYMLTVKGQRLQVVDKFSYLGSTLSRVVHIDDEVSARIAKASAAFGRLRGSVWDRNEIRLHTKLKVYRAVVLPTLMYAYEPTARQKTEPFLYKLS